MGNCLASLFGRPRRPRSYFTGRYKDYNVAVEFDNLIEDENDDGNEREVVSKSEKEHLINKQFSKLVEDQRRVDAEIDAELHQEEERTRLEEEAYIAANREAARIAKQAKRLEEQKRKKTTSNGSVKSWAGDNGDWSMANEDEEDFDSFLQTVTARSANVRASVASLSQTNQHPTQILSPEPIPVTTSEFSWDEDAGVKWVPVRTEGSPGSIPSQTHSSRKQDPFQDSTPSDLFSSQKTDSEWKRTSLAQKRISSDSS
ncbi:hypothetical protein BSL78_29349 [Apostichopus japonicus]|uniref:AP-1 complex-associated regulatory protein n=1 Tax=Stichopus japonicus TaxID=307972 RepID=A0A2G8JDJ6_STIJA|nr:hypothetical protein BSL78_29349 [Apostichopus japonicus]